MKIRLDVRKNAFENAAALFDAAKEAKAKAISLVEARRLLEAKSSAAAKTSAATNAARATARVVDLRKHEWFERFHWFKTSGGRLCIAGRDAKQNELLFSKYMEKDDLFFHADIQGAPFTLLRDGINASPKEIAEASQFAASFSSAWKRGFGVVDVYSAGKEQLSKSSHGEYVAKGGIMVSGKREWHRNTELHLAVGYNADGLLVVVPNSLSASLKNAIELLPGGEKQAAVKRVATKLGLDKAAADALPQLLP